MAFRYAGANGGGNNGEQLYYEEREKGRGSSRNARNQPPSPRYGTEPRYGSGRNGYRGDRHTIDRERFPKYDPEEMAEDEAPMERPLHASRRDRMREQGPSPQQNRHLMRHSEDRQMGGSPRNYPRHGAGNCLSLLLLLEMCP